MIVNGVLTNPRLRWLALAVMLADLSGCAGSDEGPAESTGEQPQVARTESEMGPVRVTVEIEPKKARFSDQPTLTLSIDYALGVKVEKPPFGEAVGDFVIRDFRAPLPVTKGDREIIRQVYTLEPMRTGKLDIHPIAVTFTDNRPDGDGKKHTLLTKPLSIEVESVIESEIPSLDELQPPSGPVALPEPAAATWWWLAGAGLLALAVAAAVWAIRKARKPAPEESPSNYAISARYLFTSAIWPLLAATGPGRGGEIQLTDAMDHLAREDHPGGGMMAVPIPGKRYDLGNPIDFLAAEVEFARKQLSPEELLRVGL